MLVLDGFGAHRGHVVALFGHGAAFLHGRHGVVEDPFAGVEGFLRALYGEFGADGTDLEGR